ncbi:MAG: penicillin-binding protein [Eubacterium sp.]|nr:penicillin-binding protein [Eubacterium sp.]
MKMITRRGIILWLLSVLFIAGLIFMGYSLVEEGDVWVMKYFNSHVYNDGKLLAAGSIMDRDGVVLVETKDGDRVYNDSLGLRKANLHVVGDMRGFISTGVQSVYESELVGYNILSGVYGIDSGKNGNDVKLTIDAELNRTAYNALQGRKGTIGVVNYKTGDIVCMISAPSFDVNDVPRDLDTNEIYEGAYLNRFLSGLYTPGSTFKIVTTICALENMGDKIFKDDWTCRRILDVDGIKEDNIICNDYHGKVDFEGALAKSCNSAYGEIAIKLGADKLKKTVDKLGLTSSVSVSGKISSTAGRFPLDSKAADTTVGWTGIGQGDTLINPVSMLRLMCAIANDGKAVSFNIVDDFSTQAGKALGVTFKSDETQLISSETAATVKKMMRNNVVAEYGQNRYPGLEICAKSGTAEVDDVSEHNTALFTGFLDDPDHPYAFIVVAEKGQYGLKVAGSIANTVLQAVVEQD